MSDDHDDVAYEKHRHYEHCLCVDDRSMVGGHCFLACGVLVLMTLSTTTARRRGRGDFVTRREFNLEIKKVKAVLDDLRDERGWGGGGRSRRTSILGMYHG